MVKLISFIALTHFFQFNELKILRQPGYFFKLNHQDFFTVYGFNETRTDLVTDIFLNIRKSAELIRKQ